VQLDVWFDASPKRMEDITIQSWFVLARIRFGDDRSLRLQGAHQQVDYLPEPVDLQQPDAHQTRSEGSHHGQLFTSLEKQERQHEGQIAHTTQEEGADEATDREAKRRVVYSTHGLLFA